MATKKVSSFAKKFAAAFTKYYMMADSLDCDTALSNICQYHGSEKFRSFAIFVIDYRCTLIEAAEDAGISDPYDLEPEFMQFMLDHRGPNNTLIEPDSLKEEKAKMETEHEVFASEMEDFDFQGEQDESDLADVHMELTEAINACKKNETCVPGKRNADFYDIDPGVIERGCLEDTKASKREVAKYGPGGWNAPAFRKEVKVHGPAHPRLWTSERKRQVYLKAVKQARIELAKGHERARKQFQKALDAFDSDGE